MKYRSTAFGMAAIVMLACAWARCSPQAESGSAPKLAPNQPNGSSPLASNMVAMDGQLQATLEAVMADPEHSWEGRSLMSHELLGLEPTDASMVNAHFEEHAPLYSLAIKQFNSSPSAQTYNAVVQACTDCHLGTCPGPLERIAKRRSDAH
ncbi:MAG: hypothetical protein O2990_00185 [Bacteroidetes bacterium]|nr:hypothetical protein [Bacteroidota bacterium]